MKRNALVRKALLTAWILLPVAAIAWHFGPGQYHASRDTAGALLRQANAHAQAGGWQGASAAYTQAMHALPKDARSDRHWLALAQARARIKAGEMVEGQEQLETLIEDLKGTPGQEALAIEARHELASASYYAAWLMRLEGATADEWKPEVERSRQHFRLLAEQAEASSDGAKPEANAFKRNLEAAIRLEQMDLSVLEAKPLPKECPSCKNLCQRKRKQCQSRAKSSGEKQDEQDPKKEDVRQKVKQERGAGINQRSGTGS